MHPASVNGPGTGILTGHAGVLAEAVILGDRPQPVGGREGRHAAVAVALVVGRRAPVAGAADRLEAAQVLVEAQVEIDPLHLAVGDPIEPRPTWSSMASRTASRTASSRSTGPKRSGWAATSAMNFSNQPGNDQLPITVAGIRGSLMASIPFMISAADSRHPESNGRAKQSTSGTEVRSKLADNADRAGVGYPAGLSRNSLII